VDSRVVRAAAMEDFLSPAPESAIAGRLNHPAPLVDDPVKTLITLHAEDGSTIRKGSQGNFNKKPWRSPSVLRAIWSRCCGHHARVS
jgi:hypothetical protein